MGKEKDGKDGPTEGPTLDAKTITAILREVEQERIAAHRAAKAHNAVVAEFGEAWEEKRGGLVLAVNEARGALNAYDKRLKDKMPQEEWKRERAPLEKGLKAAEKALAGAQAKTTAEAQRLNAEGRKLNARAQELGAEWRQHERIARNLGVGTDDYWVPEQPLPDDADEEEAEAP